MQMTKSVLDIIDMLVTILFHNDVNNLKEIKMYYEFEHNEILENMFTFLERKKYLSLCSEKNNVVNEEKKSLDEQLFCITGQGRMSWSNGVILGEFLWENIFLETLNVKETKIVDFDMIRIFRGLIIEKENLEELLEEYSHNLVWEIKKFYENKQATKTDNAIMSQIVYEHLTKQTIIKIIGRYCNTIVDISEAMSSTNIFMEHVKNMVKNKCVFEKYKKNFVIYIPLGYNKNLFAWNSCFEELILFQRETPYLCSFSEREAFFPKSIHREKITLKSLDFGTQKIEYIVGKDEDEYKRGLLIEIN